MNFISIYTLPDAASVLKCDRKTVERLCREGELRAFKRLRKWFILHSDLIKYIEGGEQTTTAATATNENGGHV